jgi:hypothetical protein
MEQSRRIRSLETCAFHEAGHAVVAWHERIAVRWIAIGSFGGVCRTADPIAGLTIKAGQVDHAWGRGAASIRVDLAGMIAQRRYRRSSFRRRQVGTDIERASTLAFLMMGSDAAAIALLELLYSESQTAVHSHWHRVDAVAGALLKREASLGVGALRGEEALRLIRAA